jgi:hypothetical protein
MYGSNFAICGLCGSQSSSPIKLHPLVSARHADASTTSRSRGRMGRQLLAAIMLGVGLAVLILFLAVAMTVSGFDPK